MQFKMTFLKELLSSKSFLSHKEKKILFHLRIQHIQIKKGGLNDAVSSQMILYN